MTVTLPTPIPARIAKLPRDPRGWPIPWFVARLVGGVEVDPSTPGAVADFRVISFDKLRVCCRVPHCWICGEMMGTHRVFSIGPMCAVNRVISEPPSHRQCAEWAVRACPFLAHPRARRNEKELPEGGTVSGLHIERNPGVTCLYETLDYKPFNPGTGGPGILFKLGDPVRVDWYTEGRRATRAEVEDAITTGLPVLEKIAREGGRAELAALERAKANVVPLLPVALEPQA